MTGSSILMLALALILAPLASAIAQHQHRGHEAPAGPAPGQTETLKAGMPAPDFELLDQDGTARRLSSYRGAQHVLLVFCMGEWCMGCMSQLTELARHNADFSARNVQILAVSVDGQDKALVAANRLRPGEKSPFPVLADPGRDVVRAYGVLKADFVYRDGSRHKDIASHAELLIDKAGLIRSIKTGAQMPAHFPRVGELLAEFGAF